MHAVRRLSERPPEEEHHKRAFSDAAIFARSPYECKALYPARLTPGSPAKCVPTSGFMSRGGRLFRRGAGAGWVGLPRLLGHWLGSLPASR
jgi:hypothetical protein